MLKQDFAKIVNRLPLSLGGKAYAPAQLEMAWQALLGVSGVNIESAIDALLLSHNRPPSIAALIAACRPFIRAVAERRMREKRASLPSCPMCAGTGAFFAKSSEGYDTAFRCTTCNAANVIGYSSVYAPWDEKLRDDGWRPVAPGRVANLSMQDFET